MKKSLLLSTFLAFILIGCNQVSIPDSVNSTKIVPAAEKIQVVASFYPLAFMVEEITRDKANVTNLAGSVGVHDYEPLPQDMVKINTADLVVFQGAGLEPWTDGIISELEVKGVPILEVSHNLELAKIDIHDDHEQSEYEYHDDKEEDNKEEGFDEHNHGEFDPHTWLDPILAQKMAEKIRDVLIKIDATNAEIYKANTLALSEKFRSLDQSFQSNLSQCENQEVVVSHDAFGYLSTRYGFEVHPIAGLSTNDEPSAKILAKLKNEAEEGITHILVEENNIRRFADTLALETGLKMLPVNPLGRGTLDSNKNFFNSMNDNLNSFKVALNCKS